MRRGLSWLLEAPLRPNLASDLNNQELSDLGQQVVRLYELDLQERAPWDELSRSALNLAKLVREDKTFPWPGASNVKYPLITTASIYFAARAYPEIVKNGRVTKCIVVGDDPIGERWERARRIEQHMNWQLMCQMSNWEADTDKLLHILPILGQCFRKTYFDPSLRHPVSELVLPQDCIVNAGARSMDRARRITHRIWFYANDVWERIQQGLWFDADLSLPPSISGDTDAPHEFLEQHCFEDLDGDGYREPYIVTVHRESSKVVRVVARWHPDGVETAGVSRKVVRIEPDCYFTHFGFLPNPDGSINYLGFGQLLEPLNAAINTSLNQLIDAGTLYNTGGGFITRGVRMRGGDWVFRPNEWKMVDVPGGVLKESIVPLPVREPSPVLMQLLTFLVQAGKEISAVQEILTGDARLAASMPVGTVMALAEQGLKVFVAIYKRIYRSLTEELRKLYRLNALYIADSIAFEMEGQQVTIGPSDYRLGDFTVVPVADPEISSDMQRLLKAQALKEASGRPGLNEIEVTRRIISSINPENLERLLLTDQQLAGLEPSSWRPQPTPEMVLAQARARSAEVRAQETLTRLQMDVIKFQLEVEREIAEIEELRAKAMLNLAKAESEVSDATLAEVKAEMGRIESELRQKAQLLGRRAGLGQTESDTVEGVATPPGNRVGVPTH